MQRVRPRGLGTVAFISVNLMFHKSKIVGVSLDAFVCRGAFGIEGRQCLPSMVIVASESSRKLRRSGLAITWKDATALDLCQCSIQFLSVLSVSTYSTA